MDEKNCIFPNEEQKKVVEVTPNSTTDMEVEFPANLQKKLQLHMDKFCKGMTPRQTKRYMKNKFNIILKARS